MTVNNKEGLVLIADHCRRLMKLNICAHINLSVDSITYVIRRGEGRLCKLAFCARDFADQDYIILKRPVIQLEALIYTLD